MKKLIIALLLTGSLIALTGKVYAHSGRTDSWGGHYNRVDYGIPVYEYHGN